MTRKAWQVLLAVIIGCALLIGLAVWQLQRLEWKQALIAERDRRAAAAPVSLDAAMADFEAGRPVEFLKVQTRGAFQHDGELFLLATQDGRPGFEVITPFTSEEGIVVLADRGFVPEGLRDAVKRPESQPQGAVTVTGLLSRHAGSRGLFSPDNDAGQNIWYWWDVPAMLAFARIEPDARVAPFVLHVVGQAGDPRWPRPVPVGGHLSNNHFGYAVTWFALAAILAFMAALVIRQEIKRGDA